MQTKRPQNVTDVLNEGLRVAQEESRIARELIKSKGYNDSMTRFRCQKAFSYISFLHKLKLISREEDKVMSESIMNDINEWRRNNR